MGNGSSFDSSSWYIESPEAKTPEVNHDMPSRFRDNHKEYLQTSTELNVRVNMQFVERILFSFRTTVAPESSASF